MNERLKLALIRDRRRQWEIADALGWSESQLSRVVHGRRQLDLEEQQAVADVLGVAVATLFDATDGPGSGQSEETRR